MIRPIQPRLSRLLACAITPLGLALLAHSAAAETKEKVQALDRTVVAVTDFTEAGRAFPVPTAQHPVYYTGINAGFRAYFGSVFAGDKPPDQKAMLQVITKVLADQHYLPASEAHPATQFIVVSWGTLGANSQGGAGAALGFLGGDKFDLLWEKGEVPGHIGAEIFSRRWRGSEAETVLELSGRSLYAVLIRAYSLQAAIDGRIEKLWESRLASPTLSTNLAAALPGLVVAGQHIIGRETPQPFVGNGARSRQAWVEIGESEVVEYIDATEATMAEVRRTQTSAAAGKQ